MAKQQFHQQTENVRTEIKAGGSNNPNQAPDTATPITNTKPKPTENKSK